MLREVYLNLGMAGTLLVGGVVLLTSMTWIVAVAGTVVRPMTRGRRVALLGLLTIAPPSAPLVLYRFIAAARSEYGRMRATATWTTLGGLKQDTATTDRRDG